MGQEIVNYEEKLAALATQQAQTLQTSAHFLTARAGVLKVGDIELPGNQLAGIIIGSVRENAYFVDKFDPDNIVPPTCYAFGEVETEMAPHAAMQSSPYFQPQHDQCSGCPHSVWGSSEKGRGKRCQNRHRIAIIPAGYYEPVRKGSNDYNLHLYDTLEDFEKSDIVYYKLPVTSGNAWAKYVNGLSTSIRKPTLAVITRMFLTRHEVNQYSVNFELVETLPNELLPLIFKRREEAMRDIAQPYPAPSAEQQRPAGGLKGLRRT